MKSDSEQVVNFSYDKQRNVFIIPACELSVAEALNMGEDLVAYAQGCNVAMIVYPNNNIFDSVNEPNSFTVEINDKLMWDFQKMRGSPHEDSRKTLAALIQYYSNHESLNLILLDDVLADRQSYIKFTPQLASFLRKQQDEYSQIKVAFDPTTTRLGIFCRRGQNAKLSSTFLGSIVASLHMHDSAEVLKADIPLSYLSNRAMLKHLLAQRVPNKRIKINWTNESVKVFIL